MPPVATGVVPEKLTVTPEEYDPPLSLLRTRNDNEVSSVNVPIVKL